MPRTFNAALVVAVILPLSTNAVAFPRIPARVLEVVKQQPLLPFEQRGGTRGGR